MGKIIVNKGINEVDVIGPHWHPNDTEVIKVISEGQIRIFTMTDQGVFTTKFIDSSKEEGEFIDLGVVHRFDNPEDGVVKVQITFNDQPETTPPVPNGVIEMTDVIKNLGRSSM